MTIKQAIKSGGFFRRAGWTVTGYTVFVMGNTFRELVNGVNTGRCYHPSNEDILAEDWEVVE